MDRTEWQSQYIGRLMSQGGLTHKEACDNFKAMDEVDYLSDPLDIADDELSYWGD